MRSSVPSGACTGVSFAAAARARQAPAPPRPANRRLVTALSFALGLVTVWALTASWFVLFHDEVLAGLVTQQRTMQDAYEERVGALQRQIDRSATQHLSTRDGIEGRLAALAERQALIETRQTQLAALGRDVETTSSLATPADPKLAPARKPVPTPDALELRTRSDDGAELSWTRIGPKLAGLELGLAKTAERQRIAVGDIAGKAVREAGRLRETILRTGLEPSRFEPPQRGVGGPLVPLGTDAFDRALTDAQRATGEADRLRATVVALPLRSPLTADFAFTSGFGTRLDPFTRGIALHTGLDMRADHGSLARATAPGRVTAADPSGGYGNMVEIDHGHGGVTRYAHLAGYAVMPGQGVEAGAVIGRVGSTGRSTGPHLHYETRIDGEPVDPQRFLRIGTKP